MESNENKQLEDLNVREATELVGECYVDLSKYTTRTRAYSSVVDGMKAVYRRVLFASRGYNKLVKSAAIVGDAIKLHPHGDASIYDALVRMTCKFDRFPLYKGKGNFGGQGFSAAAMRYTEACLSDLARLMYLELIDYAEMEEGEAGFEEPKYLPALIPYCLLVGSTSIPVGMPVPNIPSLNAMELIEYYIAKLEGKECRLPMPDFGGVILNCHREETIEPVIETGKGKIWFRGLITQEDIGKFVVTTETPNCSFSNLVSKCKSWINDDLLDYTDETDESGSRHVFTINNLSKLSPSTVLNKLEGALKCSVSYTFILEEDEKAVYCGLDYIIKKNLKYLRECSVRKFSSYGESARNQLLVLKAIEALKASGHLDRITKMTKEELKECIVALSTEEDIFTYEIASKAVAKPVSYLTVSHQDEIEEILIDIKKYENYVENPNEYLLTLYYELKSKLQPFYEEREHSVLRDEMNLEAVYYAKLEGDKIVISEDEQSGGMRWNKHLILVTEDGRLIRRYVSPRSSTEIDLSGDEYTYVGMASDRSEYVICVVGGKYISVKKTEDISGSKPQLKLWDGYQIDEVIYTEKDYLILVDERGNYDKLTLENWLKSRISYPSKAMKYDIRKVIYTDESES